MKNRKVIRIIIAIIIIVIGVVIMISKSKIKSKENNNTKVEQMKDNLKKLSIRYAFADVDFDQIIQDEDMKDDDEKADYIFIRFTGSINENKSKLNNIKNYKLDGKELPKESKVIVDKKFGNTQLVLMLPNNTLRGKNAGHTIEINKDIDIIDKNLKLNLPYSVKSSATENQNNIPKESKNVNNKSAKDNKDNGKNKDSKNTSLVKSNTLHNEEIPKYSIEIGKEIPFSTVVLVRLEDKDSTKYKVFVDEQKLNPKKDAKGRIVFIGGIKKDFSYEDVQSRLRIEK